MKTNEIEEITTWGYLLKDIPPEIINKLQKREINLQQIILKENLIELKGGRKKWKNKKF